MDDRFGLETAMEVSRVSLDDASKARLVRYVELLRKWQPAQNLVSRETLADVWIRHVADCLQLIPVIEKIKPGGARGVDLGSGAGLPGLILALATGPHSGHDGKDHAHGSFAMTLVESNARKASFLRTVSRETGVSVDVRASRIEDANRPTRIDADFITARALAPLDSLVGLAEPWLMRGASAFFHKGGEYARELDEWPDAHAHDVVEHMSVVDPNSRILQIARKDANLPRPAP